MSNFHEDFMKLMSNELITRGYSGWAGLTDREKIDRPAFTISIGSFKVKHLNFYVDIWQGVTICVLDSKDGGRFFGMARCHPKDNFIREIGRKAALKNAIKNLSRNSRKTVWEYYRKKTRWE